MKSKLKPPGIERLKLKCDILLSTSAFKFNMRRYTTGMKLFFAGGMLSPEGRCKTLDTAVGRCTLKPVDTLVQSN